MKSALRSLFLAPTLALSLLAVMAINANAETDVLVGEVGQFEGPDDLHLDPATVVIAVSIHGDEDREVNGVTFRTDGQGNPTGTAEEGDVSVSSTSTHRINNWANAQSFRGADATSTSNLVEIMRDIRWSAAPSPLDVEISGLAPGSLYEIQLLFNEGADRNRRWDIAVEEELVVDDFTSEGLDTQSWTPSNSAFYKGEFEAPADGILDIQMQQNIGGEPNPGGDNNPILSAVIVHRVGKTSFFFDVVDQGDNLDLIWESQAGNLYNIRSETNLAAGRGEGPSAWPTYDGNEDIEATPPLNTLTIPRPDDPTRFFAVEAFPAPPESIFFDDFESGQGDWTLGSDGADGTAWELGEPGAGPPAANSPVNCFATNLAGEYSFEADVWLRSPPIDLSAAGGATLSYFEFTDIEEGFDAGSVRILDAADNSELAVIQNPVDGVTPDWEQVKKVIPPEGLGKIIIIEFRFQSDDIQNFAGWYIDDVLVTVP